VKLIRGEQGFTLTELLVVIGLIGVMSVFALPNISSIFKVSLNSATREVASAVKEAYNATIMTGKVHRMVYDLKQNQYWVEVGPASVLLDTDASREKEERRKRFAKDEDSTPPPSFQVEKRITRKKMPLPSGVSFEDVLTEQSKEPVKDSIAYTHFFPHGLTEQTLIHLQDQSNHHITLLISPLLGQTRLIERYVTQEEVEKDDL